MVVVISLAALAAIALAAAIVAFVRDVDEEVEFGLGILAGTLLAAACVFGVIASAKAIFKDADLIALDEKAAVLNIGKRNLEGAYDELLSRELSGTGYDVRVTLPAEFYDAVDAHNDEVRRFATEVRQGAANRKNAFVSWLWSPAYEEFDLASLEGLYYVA